MNNSKYLAGIGSRQLPDEIRHLISIFATRFAKLGFALRSGGADGSDAAWEHFYDCAGGVKQIFLPWEGFNNNKSTYYEIPIEAFELSAKFHPNWPALRQSVRALMARNAQQVLGPELNEPSNLVICYTKDGCTSDATRTIKTGGTGQAISIASANNIPVFNLKNTEDVRAVYEYLDALEVL